MEINGWSSADAAPLWRLTARRIRLERNPRLSLVRSKRSLPLTALRSAHELPGSACSGQIRAGRSRCRPRGSPTSRPGRSAINSSRSATARQKHDQARTRPKLPVGRPTTPTLTRKSPLRSTSQHGRTGSSDTVCLPTLMSPRQTRESQDGRILYASSGSPPSCAPSQCHREVRCHWRHEAGSSPSTRTRERSDCT